MNINKAISLHQAGRLAEAKAAYQSILRQAPRNFNAWHLLGLAHLHMGNAPEAAACIEKALAIEPGNAEALCNLGMVLAGLARFDEAAQCFGRAVAINPLDADAQNGLGSVLATLNQHAEAQICFERAVAIKPDHPQAQHNLGKVMATQGRHAEAISRFEQAIAILKDNTAAHNDMGVALAALNRHADAIRSFETAVRLGPDHAEAHYNLGSGLSQVHEHARAMEHLERAIALQPDHAEAHNNLGNLMWLLKRPAAARQCYERTLALNPEHLNARIMYLHLCAHEALWHTGQEGELLAKILRQSNTDSIAPGICVYFVETAPAQREIARLYAGRLKRADNTPVALPRRQVSGADSRMRVAYFSGDFRAHPISYLMAELFELHDAARFDVQLVSYGPDDQSDIRKRIAASARFVDVHGLPYDTVRERIRALQPDILVDLQGYTENSLSALLAKRMAPLQVNWHGYPGTMGADFIDYIIADRFLIPAGAEDFYTEKIARLPDCYQPNDRQRSVAAAQPRAAYGLPETGVVFCSFNQVAKIRPEIFNLWLDLLGEISGSVLWIMASPNAEQNLKRVAAARGIDPARLVLAPRLPLMADHLARYRVADIALDTYPYGSHATASDALWAGCPVVALTGETFASRVSGSLLNAIGLPELVTHNREDYKRLLLRLAQSAPYRQEVRARLQHNRDTAPLFDTPRFARNLERAYEAMIERARAGLPPDHIQLPALP